MQKQYFIFCIFLCLGIQVQAQKYRLSGFVKDLVTKEAIAGAFLQNTTQVEEGAVSNEYGFFSLTTAQPVQSLKVGAIGYADKEIVATGEEIEILLSQKVLETVVISDEIANRNVENNEMGHHRLDIRTLKQLPVLLGETDPLKSISLLPGIKQANEGSTGFVVRGGNADQNLILLDDAILYNPSHLAGFLSVFNGDAVKQVEVLKGAIPANYGGRLSSVVNISTREGNMEKFVGSGGVGLLTTRLSLEGPTKKGKGSFMLAGRRTFFDAFLVPFLPKGLKGNTYYFYDLNLKANYQIGEKDRLYLTAYTGQDVLKVNVPTGTGIKVNINYGNQLAALRWNHVFNSRLFANTTLSYNRYHIVYDSKLGNNTLYIPSRLQDVSLKHDYQYYPSPRYTLRFGGQYLYHQIHPGNSESNQSGTMVTSSIADQRAHEGAFYFSSDYHASEKLSFNIGLRYSLFNMVGAYHKLRYNEAGEVIDTVQTYKRGQSVQFYKGLEPRASLRYLLSTTSSLKAAYTRTFQYIQMATTSSGLLPTDIWVAASPQVKPQIGDQFSIGYFRNFKENKYETSVELYYRNMQNQIELLPSMPLVYIENVEQYMRFGRGNSYGMEIFIKRNVGKTTGWIAYTLAKSLRTFPDLNKGNPFPTRNDRRHEFSAMFQHIFNEKWTGSLVWSIASGNAATLPTNRFNYFLGFPNGTATTNSTAYYTSINAYRLPTYHRADISFTYTPKPKKARKIHSSWNFAAYNLYSRLNPFFMYLEVDATTQQPVAKGLSILPIVPSVTWNFKF